MSSYISGSTIEKTTVSYTHTNVREVYASPICSVVSLKRLVFFRLIRPFLLLDSMAFFRPFLNNDHNYFTILPEVQTQGLSVLLLKMSIHQMVLKQIVHSLVRVLGPYLSSSHLKFLQYFSLSNLRSSHH